MLNSSSPPCTNASFKRTLKTHEFTQEEVRKMSFDTTAFYE